MIDFDLGFVGTVSDDELRRLMKPENREELKERMDEYKQKKTGHWEMKPDPFGFFDEIPVCSECGCTNAMRKKQISVSIAVQT